MRSSSALAGSSFGSCGTSSPRKVRARIADSRRSSSAERGGSGYREAQLVMEMVVDTGRLGLLDIVELNPAFDKRNLTGKFAIFLVESLFGKSTLMCG